jgi:RNA polymerase sigma factor (sigma-70 family)
MGSHMAAVLRYIGHVACVKEGDAPSDSQLLQQFVDHRDEGAFATLLQRHGPLVFGYCRQVLRDLHAAEDAFQATFLVLARKAASIRKHESLAPWLHRVALNISHAAKTSAAQRHTHERQAALMSQPHSASEVTLRDWQPLLHEEVNQLPEKYRVPVILCYFEGKTHEEAARRLAWPVGTVKGRLARARDLLRTRLARRGVTLSGAGLAAALAQGAALAHVPAALLGSTLKAAVSFTSKGVITAAASVQVLTLAKEALQTMTAPKLAHVVVLMVMVGVVGLGGVIGLGFGREARPEDPFAQKSASLPVHKEDAAPPAGESIQLTLASDRQEYRQGESVDLILIIKNNGKEEFSHPIPKLIDLHGFEMTGPDGKEVKPVMNPVEISFANIPVVVRAGEAVTIKDALQGINLPKNPKTDSYRRHVYYPMDKPGFYLMRIKVGEVTSNQLKIKVLEKEESAAPQPKDRITEMAERLAALPTALLKEQRTDDQIVEAVVLATLMKLPTPEQRDSAKKYLQKKANNRKQACDDIIWAYVNTKEFRVLHGFTMAEISILEEKLAQIAARK